MKLFNVFLFVMCKIYKGSNCVDLFFIRCFIIVIVLVYSSLLNKYLLYE